MKLANVFNKYIGRTKKLDIDINWILRDRATWTTRRDGVAMEIQDGDDAGPDADADADADADEDADEDRIDEDRYRGTGLGPSASASASTSASKRGAKDGAPVWWWESSRAKKPAH